MLDIFIRTISDKDQRYDTVGDYQTDECGKQVISVSDLNNDNFEFLIALHELIESKLCKERGITDSQIDKFDIDYESNREDGDQESEPGDQPDAPYHKEHVFASRIEKMMADELGVDWEKYSKACSELTGSSN
tara:strand:- start:378 stop:776 length:399 start_codon:yes stop_codon:yes gene_type:complete